MYKNKGMLLVKMSLIMIISAGIVEAATPGAAFLKIGVGGRPIGMGEAYAAVADDVNAIYWNPAGLMQIKKTEMAFAHNELFEAIRHENVAIAKPMLNGVVGVSGTYLWIEGIEGRSTDNPEVERMIPVWDASVSVAYAKKMSKKLSMGVSAKGISQQLDDKNAMGLAVDVGFLYKYGKNKPNLGLAIQNVGYESAFISEASPLPMNIKAGISNKYNKNRIIGALDGNYSVVDGNWSIGAGCDWQMHKVFSLRLGYKYASGMQTLGALAGMSAGLGFKVSVFDIDYAFVPYGDLGYTHRASFRIEL